MSDVIETVAGLHKLYDKTAPGETLLINNRVNELIVTDHFDRESNFVSDHNIIELKGNGTTYHILCDEGQPSTKPIIFKKSEWSKHDGTFRYRSNGRRVNRVQR